MNSILKLNWNWLVKMSNTSKMSTNSHTQTLEGRVGKPKRAQCGYEINNRCPKYKRQCTARATANGYCKDHEGACPHRRYRVDCSKCVPSQPVEIVDLDSSEIIEELVEESVDETVDHVVKPEVIATSMTSIRGTLGTVLDYPIEDDVAKSIRLYVGMIKSGYRVVRRPNGEVEFI